MKPSEPKHCWFVGGVAVTYERSVTWTKVSLNEAKIRATPKTSSPIKVEVSLLLGQGAQRASYPSISKSSNSRFRSLLGRRILTHHRGSEDRERCSPPCARPSFPWVPFLRCFVRWSCWENGLRFGGGWVLMSMGVLC